MCFIPPSLRLFNLCVLQTQQHKFVNWQCDLEYRGEDFTSAVTLGNPDVLVGSGTILLKVLYGLGDIGWHLILT